MAWHRKKIRRIKFSPRVAYESESQNARTEQIYRVESSRVEEGTREGEAAISSLLLCSLLFSAALVSTHLLVTVASAVALSQSPHQ